MIITECGEQWEVEKTLDDIFGRTNFDGHEREIALGLWGAQLGIEGVASTLGVEKRHVKWCERTLLVRLRELGLENNA